METDEIDIISIWCRQNVIERNFRSTEKADIFVLARFGDLETFKNKFVLDDINNLNGGYGLLHQALAGNNFDIALFLIDQNIDVNMKDSEGGTALHYICEKQVVFEDQNLNVIVAKKLLQKGADIHLRDKRGNSTMMPAVINSKGRNYEMVSLFMEYNADILIKNNFGVSALDKAKTIGYERLINILLKK